MRRARLDTLRPMLQELTEKQRELTDLATNFQSLSSFAAALRKATKGKPFRVSNELAWEALQALHRIIIIDLAAWIASVHEKWLLRNLQGTTLAGLRTSKRLGAKQAAEGPVRAPPRVERAIREHRATQIHESRRAALKRLFGPAAAERGHATHADVLRLTARLGKWARPLAEFRHSHAHRYGFIGSQPKGLRMQDLARRIASCGRLLNDLRLLIDASMYVMPSLSADADNPLSRDLVDLIVVGTIGYAVEQWEAEPGPFLWQKRDAYYKRLHRRGRTKRGDVFNAPHDDD